MARQTIILKAENGAIIAADDTGLVMRLSDRVIRDIARRLSISDTSPIPQPAGEEAGGVGPDSVDAAMLGDIDAWDVRKRGDWLDFAARLPGVEGDRRYLRHVSGPAILAQTPGQVLGLISIAGPRRYNATSREPAFPNHVISLPVESDPGEEPALFDNMQHAGIDCEIADAALKRRYDAHRGLPLFAVQPCLLLNDDAAWDRHLEQLRQALKRLNLLSEGLGKTAALAAICVEIGTEQIPHESDALSVHQHMLQLLDQLSAEAISCGYPPPRFILTLDCGAWWSGDAAAARALAEGFTRLVLCPGPHDVSAAGSTARLAQDILGQPTEEARHCQGQLESLALEARLRREAWMAPVLCLAEREGPRNIRAVFKAQEPLCLESDDPANAGFALPDAPAGTEITGIVIHPDDDRAISLTLNRELPRDGMFRLDYAIPAGPGQARSAWHGALRDEWQFSLPSGEMLYRWALPASQVLR